MAKLTTLPTLEEARNMVNKHVGRKIRPYQMAEEHLMCPPPVVNISVKEGKQKPLPTAVI